MPAEGCATAKELTDTVGWQIPSVRGFIAVTLNKHADGVVTTARAAGATRSSVKDAVGSEATSSR